MALYQALGEIYAMLFLSRDSVRAACWMTPLLLFAGCQNRTTPSAGANAELNMTQTGNERVNKDQSVWVQIECPSGHFAVSFPSKPKHEHDPKSNEDQYLLTTPDPLRVFLMAFRPGVDSAISLDERLAIIRQSLKVVDFTITDVVICGIPAKQMSHEYDFGGRKLTSRKWIFYTRNGLCQLSLTAEKAVRFPEEDARRFLSSFQLQ